MHTNTPLPKAITISTICLHYSRFRVYFCLVSETCITSSKNYLALLSQMKGYFHQLQCLFSQSWTIVHRVHPVFALTGFSTCLSFIYLCIALFGTKIQNGHAETKFPSHWQFYYLLSPQIIDSGNTFDVHPQMKEEIELCFLNFFCQVLLGFCLLVYLFCLFSFLFVWYLSFFLAGF